MSSVQYACNSTEASAPWCFIKSVITYRLLKKVTLCCLIKFAKIKIEISTEFVVNLQIVASNVLEKLPKSKLCISELKQI